MLGTLLLCGAGLTLLDGFGDRVQARAGQLQASVVDHQRQLRERQRDRQSLQENISHYRALRDKGLVGSADRTLWVEQFEDAFRQARLPGELSYQMDAARPLIARQDAVEPAVSAAVPLVHDLQFELRGVHEAEVLQLIRDYSDRVKGSFRVNSCKLFDPTPAGLTAQCVLRFLTVPDTAANGVAS